MFSGAQGNPRSTRSTRGKTLAPLLLLILLVGTFYATFAVAGAEPDASFFVSLLSMRLAQIATLLIFALLSSKGLPSKRTTFLCCTAGLLCVFVLTVINVDIPALRAILALALGTANGAGFVFIAQHLSRFEPKAICIVICAGSALGALISSLSHFGGATIVQVGLACALIFEALATFMVMTPSFMDGAASQDGIAETPTGPFNMRAFRGAYYENGTFAFLLLSLALFSLCYGVFESFPHKDNYSMAHTPAPLAVFAILATLYCLLSVAALSHGKFGKFSLCTVSASLALGLALFALPSYSPRLFVALAADFAFAQTILLVMLTLFSHKNISAFVVLSCYAAIIIAAAHLLGQVLAFALPATIGADYAIVSKTASLGTALICFGSLALTARGSWKNDSTPLPGPADAASGKPTANEGASTDMVDMTGTAAFDAFCKEYGISQREHDVLVWYLRGWSVKAITEKLFLAESTIRSYLHHVYVKTGLHSKQELIEAVSKRQQ